MATFLTYNATSVTPVADGVQIPVPVTPTGVGIATVIVTVPPSHPANIVQVSAEVGVRGDGGTGSLLFRLFRDGVEIYYSRQGIESAAEQFEIVGLQALDANVPAGAHAYTLSVEILTPAGFTATVIGPLNISGAVYGL